MSRLSNMTNSHKQVQRRLFATASAAALLGFMIISGARAADADKPIVWFDVSGQLDQLSDSQQRWAPDFLSGPNTGPLSGMFQDIQKTPRFGYDANASLSVFPGDAGWIFSASVRIGRARQPGRGLKQDHILPTRWGNQYASQYGSTSHETESHLFLDFAVGKDVGLGIAGAESIVSAGVKFANLHSRSDVQISSGFPSVHGSAINRADTRISRNFRGWGPKLSWDASAPIAGTPDDGQLGIDWGLNVSLLFGRQSAKQKLGAFYLQSFHKTQTTHSTNLRRKTVTVPALGAYVAASYNLPNAKLSLGYRADWYFNALDGGVAAADKVNRGFYGPYASISVGVSPSDF
jgi:hypothetical protein